MKIKFKKTASFSLLLLILIIPLTISANTADKQNINRSQVGEINYTEIIDNYLTASAKT